MGNHIGAPFGDPLGDPLRDPQASPPESGGILRETPLWDSPWGLPPGFRGIWGASGEGILPKTAVSKPLARQFFDS